MKALMFRDDIFVRVLTIEGKPWLIGLDVIQAAKIQVKDEARRYAELPDEHIRTEPNPIRGRPRKLVSPEGAKILLPDAQFARDEGTGRSSNFVLSSNRTSQCPFTTRSTSSSPENDRL